MSMILVAFFSAFIFGLGLGLGGMTLPSKVIGFLDIGGHWDPSLAFVMIGAIAVHSLSFRLITKRSSPVLSAEFQIPKRRDIDKRLVIGSMVFGIGWAIAGYCPGPALVASAQGHVPQLLFVGSMTVGMYLYRLLFAPKSP